MKGICDVGAEYTYADRLAYEAGRIGDELYPEPEYDDFGLPIVDDGLPIMVKENGKIWWVD